jgi:3-dehydroquinate synthase
MASSVVPVDIPGAVYNVHVQAGLLAEAGPMLRRLSQHDKVGLVTDSNVEPLYAPALESALDRQGLTVVKAVIPAGEQNKTLGQIERVYDAMLRAGIERSTVMVALGGGVVGDMTGFAAATLLRGVPFVQMPTSLLAMVDASVGGKTGIDHAVGKNLIGAFYQPKTVLIDPATLATLPPRELRSGLAECIKHEIIRDAAGFARLEDNIERAVACDIAYLSELVAHNVAIKAGVVEADPFENADRAHLNFGHTFGHAIERVSNYAYSHGEAVALGMVAATHVARQLGMVDAGAQQRIVRLIGRAGLPTAGLTLDVAEVVAAMSVDKKVKSRRLRFVLPVAIGAVVIRDDVPDSLVKEAVESLR